MMVLIALAMIGLIIVGCKTRKRIRIISQVANAANTNNAANQDNPDQSFKIDMNQNNDQSSGNHFNNLRRPINDARNDVVISIGIKKITFDDTRKRSIFILVEEPKFVVQYWNETCLKSGWPSKYGANNFTVEEYHDSRS